MRSKEGLSILITEFDELGSDKKLDMSSLKGVMSIGITFRLILLLLAGVVLCLRGRESVPGSVPTLWH